jgi:hypothetical protein
VSEKGTSELHCLETGRRESVVVYPRGAMVGDEPRTTVSLFLDLSRGKA